jgi:DNA-binding MarR family transcriptional regulator
MPGGKLKLVEAGNEEAYRLHEQVGFILRKANQRHIAIFAKHIGDLTPPQFAALARLAEIGEASQNQLGAMVAMDAATIKGVVLRLSKRSLVETVPDPDDARRLTVRLTEQGKRLARKLTPRAMAISQVTMAPLTQDEQARLVTLLLKLK